MTSHPAPTTYYVVPCAAAKTDHPAPAADLYVSPNFRTTLARVTDEATHDGGQVLILSALHCLVRPDQVIAPYDVKMGDPDSITVDALTAQVLDGNTAGATLYAFLPAAYRDRLDLAARAACDEVDDDVVTVQDVYEAAPGIGYQRGVCASLARALP